MGLRCLIGHEYGDPQTSRDRNQRGNEVIVTVREYRECTRCGHRRILSENKEVTTEGAETSTEEPAAEASWSGDPDAAGDAADEALDRSASDPSSEDDEPMTAEEDDGIILEDEPESAERPHGKWPEADVGQEPEADADDEPEPWPDESGEPESDEAEPPAEDPLDAGPEASGEADDGSTAEEPAAATEADATADEPEPSPRPDKRNTEFVCPDCGETWTTRNASLRPGDICPECRRGYLDERVVQ